MAFWPPRIIAILATIRRRKTKHNQEELPDPWDDTREAWMDCMDGRFLRIGDQTRPLDAENHGTLPRPSHLSTGPKQRSNPSSSPLLTSPRRKCSQATTSLDGTVLSLNGQPRAGGFYSTAMVDWRCGCIHSTLVKLRPDNSTIVLSLRRRPIGSGFAGFIRSGAGLARSLADQRQHICGAARIRRRSFYSPGLRNDSATTALRRAGYFLYAMAKATLVSWTH